MLIIGLTGDRGVGKSEIVRYLVKHHGFQQTHSFAPGKTMFISYLERKRVPHDIAFQMVYGDLRDVPSKYLPNNATPRYFMEKFGYFMGHDLGGDWTLGVEIENAIYDNVKMLIVDSVVYEEDVINKYNGIIVRVTRPGKEHNAHIDAPNTTAANKIVKEHAVLENNGSLEDLQYKTQQLIGVYDLIRSVKHNKTLHI